MPRPKHRKHQPSRVDAAIDELLAEAQSPADILGESGFNPTALPASD